MPHPGLGTGCVCDSSVHRNKPLTPLPAPGRFYGFCASSLNHSLRTLCMCTLNPDPKPLSGSTGTPNPGSLNSKNPPVNCLVNLLVPDSRQALASCQDCCLIQQVGQVSTSKAGGAQGNLRIEIAQAEECKDTSVSQDSFSRLARSAPAKPGVRRATCRHRMQTSTVCNVCQFSRLARSAPAKPGVRRATCRQGRNDRQQCASRFLVTCDTSVRPTCAVWLANTPGSRALARRRWEHPRSTHSLAA
jgi:hypothetical protein